MHIWVEEGTFRVFGPLNSVGEVEKWLAALGYKRAGELCWQKGGQRAHIARMESTPEEALAHLKAAPV